ncbi:hypothetical protein [Amycolatopsis sp. H20-H5]|uniref:hypothetical protein n=1 Tax=Amycolatopsis sp. H20-H5 TaxID=3046309 RepID=UPI002DBB2DDB|nr:hypothetical protein [Amycolatopsis sp. H20-H5]MEC3975280.1 hypothetical protein [Amycolatopsis sp. H20-H5]
MREGLIGKLLLAAGLALVPWIAVLWGTLPDTYDARNWRAAWIGFDALEAGGLLASAWLFRRRDHRAPLAAIGSAMLLLVDAWFDVVTAGEDLVFSLLMAGALELPLAALCLVAALRGVRMQQVTRPFAVRVPAHV